MRQHCETLRMAIEAGAVPAAINALVSIAEKLIERKDKERAAEVLALVLCYPMSRETREFAEVLFADMEAELCPRAIFDARVKADELTLDDMALEILSYVAE